MIEEEPAAAPVDLEEEEEEGQNLDELNELQQTLLDKATGTVLIVFELFPLSVNCSHCL